MVVVARFEAPPYVMLPGKVAVAACSVAGGGCLLVWLGREPHRLVVVVAVRTFVLP